MKIFQSKGMRQNLISALKSSETTDIVLTYYHSKNQIAALNQSELLTQLKHWKAHQMIVRKSNVRLVNLDGVSVYLFVVQFKDDKMLDEIGVCPFSAALGLMVSGIGYICKSRPTLDVVLRYIGIEGATPNPLFTIG
jgi:hypothetical protein